MSDTPDIANGQAKMSNHANGRFHKFKYICRMYKAHQIWLSLKKKSNSFYGK